MQGVASARAKREDDISRLNDSPPATITVSATSQRHCWHKECSIGQQGSRWRYRVGGRASLEFGYGNTGGGGYDTFSARRMIGESLEGTSVEHVHEKIILIRKRRRRL